MGSLGVWKARVDLEGTRGWEEIPFEAGDNPGIARCPCCSFPPHINLFPPFPTPLRAPRALFQWLLSEVTFMYTANGPLNKQTGGRSPIMCCALCRQWMPSLILQSSEMEVISLSQKRNSGPGGCRGRSRPEPPHGPKGVGPPACLSHSRLRQNRNLEP